MTRLEHSAFPKLLDSTPKFRALGTHTVIDRIYQPKNYSSPYAINWISDEGTYKYTLSWMLSIGKSWFKASAQCQPYSLTKTGRWLKVIRSVLFYEKFHFSKIKRINHGIWSYNLYCVPKDWYATCQMTHHVFKDNLDRNLERRGYCQSTCRGKYQAEMQYPNRGNIPHNKISYWRCKNHHLKDTYLTLTFLSFTFLRAFAAGRRRNNLKRSTCGLGLHSSSSFNLRIGIQEEHQVPNLICQFFNSRETLILPLFCRHYLIFHSLDIFEQPLRHSPFLSQISFQPLCEACHSISFLLRPCLSFL